MGLMDFLKKRKTEVGLHITYGLTPLGKTKAEAYATASPAADVLACLNENGVSTVAEIAEEVKTSPQKVKMILKTLIRSGYVRRVSQED